MICEKLGCQLKPRIVLFCHIFCQCYRAAHCSPLLIGIKFPKILSKMGLKKVLNEFS